MFPSIFAMKCFIFVCVLKACIDVTMRKIFLGMLLDVIEMSFFVLNGVECVGWCCIVVGFILLGGCSSLADRVLFSNLCYDLNDIF